MTSPSQGPQLPRPPHLPGLSGYWPSAAPPRPPGKPAEKTNSRIPVLPAGYRWYASRPKNAIPPRRRPPRPATPTPQYASTPRWGLVQTFPPVFTHESSPHRKNSLLSAILIILPIVIIWCGLFSLAEAIRYCLALYGRGHLVPGIVAALSGFFITTTVVVTLVSLIIAGVVLAWWLRQERESAYALNGRSDPRSAAEIILLTVLPFVNMLTLGVLFHELHSEHSRGGHHKWHTTLHSWWRWWAAGYCAIFAYIAWSLDTSLQARTELLIGGSLLGIFFIFVAFKTRHLIRVISGLSSEKSPTSHTRWLPVAAPADTSHVTALSATPELGQANNEPHHEAQSSSVETALDKTGISDPETQPSLTPDSSRRLGAH